MESQSIKEKIFYWGGLTLITSVIIGGSYYVYKSIFNSEDENENKNTENDNNFLSNSFLINNKNEQNINNNINENNLDNNIDNNNKTNNINSTIFPKSINNLLESDNNIINTKK